jgi:hypothetical protein
LIVLKRVSWGLIALSVLVGSEAAASNYAEAVGTVTIDKTCGKTAITDLKVLVLEETPMGYSRARRVPMDEKGMFSVLVSKSYKYTFQVKLIDEVFVRLEGKASFDPTYSENKPTIVATCSQVEQKEKGKA